MKRVELTILALLWLGELRARASNDLNLMEAMARTKPEGVFMPDVYDLLESYADELEMFAQMTSPVGIGLN